MRQNRIIAIIPFILSFASIYFWGDDTVANAERLHLFAIMDIFVKYKLIAL